MIDTFQQSNKCFLKLFFVIDDTLYIFVITYYRWK